MTYLSCFLTFQKVTIKWNELLFLHDMLRNQLYPLSYSDAGTITP